jgi:hypothetical protein
MPPPLVASHCPNGPTFAVPRNWSNAVLSKGSNSAGDQGDGRQVADVEATDSAAIAAPVHGDLRR